MTINLLMLTSQDLVEGFPTLIFSAAGEIPNLAIGVNLVSNLSVSDILVVPLELVVRGSSLAYTPIASPRLRQMPLSTSGAKGVQNEIGLTRFPSHNL